VIVSEGPFRLKCSFCGREALCVETIFQVAHAIETSSDGIRMKIPTTDGCQAQTINMKMDVQDVPIRICALCAMNAAGLIMKEEARDDL
jgi:hypothetical protein